MISQQEGSQAGIGADKGFTLVELLVAILILSVGLLGMATLTGSIIRQNKLSNDLSTATTLAEDKMGDIRTVGYASVANETKAVCATPFSEYKREVIVNNDTPSTGMKKVTVRVYWGASDAHHVEVKTILCE